MLDVIELPISDTSKFDGSLILPVMYNNTFTLHPAQMVFAIGYPLGNPSSDNWLPIYEAGFVSSEPALRFFNKPLFLIDINAFVGMSGSPVYCITYDVEDPVQNNSRIGKRNVFFEGVFSAIKQSDTLENSRPVYGIVWKAGYLEKYEFDKLP